MSAIAPSWVSRYSVHNKSRDSLIQHFINTFSRFEFIVLCLNSRRYPSKMDKSQANGGVVLPVNIETLQNKTKTGSLVELPFKKVVIHPLVLLSVVDHFNRMGKIGNQKRVVGILLGAIKGKGILDISNSFAGRTSEFVFGLFI